MEGLQIFKLYLKYIGILEYKGSNDLEKTKDYHRFTEFHGDISMDVRTANKDTFNLPEN